MDALARKRTARGFAACITAYEALWHADGRKKRAGLVPPETLFAVGYALPGATMSWKLPGDAPHGAGAVRARINGEESESTLVVDPGGR